MEVKKNRFLGEVLGSTLVNRAEIFDRSVERGYREILGHCYGIPKQLIEVRNQFLSRLPEDFLKWTRDRQVEFIADKAYDEGVRVAAEQAHPMAA